MQVTERTVTGAEIVHQQRNSKPAQADQNLNAVPMSGIRLDSVISSPSCRLETPDCRSNAST